MKYGKRPIRNSNWSLIVPPFLGSHLKPLFVENLPTLRPETSAPNYKFSGMDGKPTHERKRLSNRDNNTFWLLVKAKRMSALRRKSLQ
jgi:hypothetical protein